MSKKEPEEKEKILWRLTEKEIRAQLYGYGAAHPAAGDPQGEPKKPARPDTDKADGEESPNLKPLPKNPYLIWQIVLLAFFLILIWLSIRQIIKIVSHSFDAKVSIKSGSVKTVGKVRILQPNLKGAAKR